MDIDVQNALQTKLNELLAENMELCKKLQAVSPHEFEINLSEFFGRDDIRKDLLDEVREFFTVRAIFPEYCDTSHVLTVTIDSGASLPNPLCG